MDVAKNDIESGFNASNMFTMLDLNPSYYYRIANEGTERAHGGGRPIPGYSFNINGEKVFDGQIEEYIMELIGGEAFGYGYYKIYILKKVSKTYCLQQRITASNQLWETDVKYGYITGEDRFFYILSYLDVFDRDVVDDHIGLNCTGKDAAFTLKNALKRRNIDPKESNLVIRSDNGPQFISQVFEGSCIELGVEHARIPAHTPNKNAHIESFHRILEDDYLSMSLRPIPRPL